MKQQFSMRSSFRETCLVLQNYTWINILHLSLNKFLNEI